MLVGGYTLVWLHGMKRRGEASVTLGQFCGSVETIHSLLG